jgi:inosine-uridine nucleoside N-ribohydrolase
MPTLTPVLVDTDVDIDDWMAILFLMQHPGVRVLGISTTGCGAAHLTAAGRNARDLLMLTAAPQTPVAQGTSTPLIYSNQFPNSIRNGIDDLFGLTLPTNPAPLDPRPAVEFLYQTLRDSPEPVTVLAIGGLTNLGMLLRAYPQVLPKITRLVVMGGAIDVPGNVYDVDSNYLNKVAEWNIFLDPLGAKIVFESGVPITLVPLDASQFVPMDKAFYNRFAAAASTPAARFVHDALTADLSFVISDEFFFWDPLAAAILADPSLVVSSRPASPQSLSLAVLQALDEEQDTSGQLVRAASGASVQVAMWADKARFYDQFIETLNRTC